MERPFWTSSVTKSSNAVISTASAAISSAMMRRDHHHAFAVADHDVARKHRCVAAADRHVDVERLVQRDVGRRRRAVVIGGDGELGDLGRIAEAAVGDHARRAAHHQARHQDRARRCGARVLAAVDDEHGAGRAVLDGLALRMRAILEHADGVEILARRDVAQREGLADHRLGVRIERMHVLDELIAQAALVERRAQRRRAHGLELVARLRLQLGHDFDPLPRLT